MGKKRALSIRKRALNIRKGCLRTPPPFPPRYATVKPIFMIRDFSENAFEKAEFWCIVGLTAFLRLLQNKNSTFY